MGAGSSNKPEAGGAPAGLSGRQLPGTPPGGARRRSDTRKALPGRFVVRFPIFEFSRNVLGLYVPFHPGIPNCFVTAGSMRAKPLSSRPPDPGFPQVSRTDALGRVHWSRVGVNRMKEPGKLPETALPAAGGPSAVPRQRVLQRLSPRGFSPLGWGTAW